MKAAVLALVLLLAAPAALAEDPYANRYVIDGRLVGADGLPLAGRIVEPILEEDSPSVPCEAGHRNQTDEWGDFHFCFAHGNLSAGTKVGVRYGNTSLVRPADVAFRRSVMLLQEPTENGTAPEGWTTTYHLTGRAWQAGAIEIEGVQVFGSAVADLPVSVTFQFRDGAQIEARSITDGAGDFVITIELPGDEIPEKGTLEADVTKQGVVLNETFHRTHTPVYVSAYPGADFPPGRPFEFTPPPGSSIPRVSPVLFLVMGLALAATVALAWKKPE